MICSRSIISGSTGITVLCTIAIREDERIYGGLFSHLMVRELYPNFTTDDDYDTYVKFIMSQTWFYVFYRY